MHKLYVIYFEPFLEFMNLSIYFFSILFMFTQTLQFSNHKKIK